MITEPQLETREPQHYVAIRAQVTQPEIGDVLPPLWPEVFGWLGANGLAPTGAPFIRYVEFDRSGTMDVEVGVPLGAQIPEPVEGNQRIVPGVLHAGVYATLTHTGPYSELMSANKALQDWAAARGIQWRYTGDAAHSVWAGRLESYLTDPAKEPDPAKWITVVSYLTKAH